ncbi:hypothetical protein HMPREF9248_0722 [Fannyhessea vaginae PB189-T1-4]|uniref:Uncharacterized protein n=1 Tax=Fannyhessea vaginae PB189-T1-4 TaxID=866774 RepID=A0ABN0AYQ6_9ACTN|nr:hypothetical protein HMPREF9248_0722 [Fannyhessea vaginae PB189-T1-4]
MEYYMLIRSWENTSLSNGTHRARMHDALCRLYGMRGINAR